MNGYVGLSHHEIMKPTLNNIVAGNMIPLIIINQVLGVSAEH